LGEVNKAKRHKIGRLKLILVRGPKTERGDC